MSEDKCPCFECDICSNAVMEGISPQACKEYIDWKKRINTTDDKEIKNGLK